jgi:ELAV like protein 2/3/4
MEFAEDSAAAYELEQGSGDSESTNLIVNYLPQTLTDDEFYALFAAIGPVKNSKIIRDKMTNYSFGFGFVNYESPESAVKAIETLNGLKLQNKSLKVAYSRPGENVKGANLYVKNIPKEMSEEDLVQYFAPYGTIVQCRILTDTNTGRSKGVGFVLYETRDQAIQAVGALDGFKLEGYAETLAVKFAEENHQKNKPKVVVVRAPAAGVPPLFAGAYGGAGPVGRRGGMGAGPVRGRGRGQSSRFNPIQGGTRYRAPLAVGRGGAAAGAEDGYILFVYNIGPDTDENTLWQVFAEYGEILRVNVIRDHVKQQGKGYGFVTMTNYYEAVQAIQSLNGYNMFGKPLQVSFKTDNK